MDTTETKAKISKSRKVFCQRSKEIRGRKNMKALFSKTVSTKFLEQKGIYHVVLL